MRSTLLLVIFVSTALISFGLGTRLLKAQDLVISSTPKPVVSPSPEGTVLPTSDITQPTQETLGPLEKILEEQKLGPIWPKNPIKYAIRAAIESGVPANTIVLLLLLPVVAAIIAAARHLIGLRGFGIFLPAPIIRRPELTNVSIFAVLILVLLAEDFTRVQLGKSAKVAINLTTETLILSLVSYMFLTLEPLQKFALLNPEILILSVAVFDFLLGKYAGLRFLEFWRFRKLING